ncbi:MAG: hypothetical protein JXP37_08565, partial [Coriobacteriia bacterium]|nr:hypothetical protein [Coriobacteriia bacterium]
MGRAEILHWSPKDYLSDFKTAGLTLHEEGAYRRLLDHMWIGTDEQCVFPLDFLALAAVWRVPSEEAVTLVERLTDGPGAVLKIKHTRDGDVLFSKRLHV